MENQRNDSSFGSSGMDLNFVFSGGRCQGTGVVQFARSPMDPQDIGFLLPLGLMVNDHVTPVDHEYFSPTVFRSARDSYPVYAIANATIVSIQHRVSEASSGRPMTDEYRVVFEHTCTLYSYFDLLTSLDPALLSQAHFDGLYSNARIPVNEGQLIGRIGGQTLDFSVFNEEVRLAGFVNASDYQREPWKIHVDNPLPYFSPSVRAMLESKLIRTAEPRIGKIDYDQDGKLAGNWFLNGTNGYAGLDREHPSKGHLAFAYDYLDPSQIRVSTGDFAGQGSQQFGVKGNAPDPASISVQSGLIRYDLVPFDYRSGTTNQPWDRMSMVPLIHAINYDDQPSGSVLVQLVANRTLNVEFFPQSAGPSPATFDQNVRTYIR